MNSAQRVYKTSLILVAFMFSAVSLQAANWTGTDQADWNTPSNWTGGIVPGDTGYSGNTAITNGNKAWISDAVPNVDTGRLEISNTGSGFDVRSGGSITFSQQLWMRNNSTVNVSGGTLNSPSRFYIGMASGDVAEVNLQSGTINDSGTFWMGNAGSHGTLNITGGTLNSSGEFHIGRGTGGSGTVNLSNGDVNYTGTSFIIGLSGASGSFNQSGGSVSSSSSMTLGRYDGTGGTYSISGGAFSITNVTTSGPNARFEVTDAWDVPDVTNEIDISGNLTLNRADSTLAFNLGADGIQQIVVGGTANLSNATLEIAFANGYNGLNLLGGEQSRVFNLLLASTISTTGLTLEDNLTGGLSVESWAVSDGALSITVIPEPSSLVLLLLGALVFAAFRRKKELMQK